MALGLEMSQQLVGRWKRNAIRVTWTESSVHGGPLGVRAGCTVPKPIGRTRGQIAAHLCNPIHSQTSWTLHGYLMGFGYFPNLSRPFMDLKARLLLTVISSMVQRFYPLMLLCLRILGTHTEPLPPTGKTRENYCLKQFS